ncbi:MAG: type II toxin-antitoxin system VapC family toxin [Bacteroidales bacterium]|nr:type II toxin-antitoxin system VapC family toxin [Bacteroidales bacterium]
MDILLDTHALIWFINGDNQLSEIITKYDFELLPIDIEHIAEIIGMEFHHRDPFDRIIIAQAMVEKTPIITKDKYFNSYNIKTIWN